jgi:hypothetical protein
VVSLVKNVSDVAAHMHCQSKLIENIPATTDARYHHTSSKIGTSKPYIIIFYGNDLSIEITEKSAGNGTFGDSVERKIPAVREKIQY